MRCRDRGQPGRGQAPSAEKKEDPYPTIGNRGVRLQKFDTGRLRPCRIRPRSLVWLVWLVWAEADRAAPDPAFVEDGRF